MATFRFGNGRSIARKYAFKFNLKATLYSSSFDVGFDTKEWQVFTFEVGAEVIFTSLNGDNFNGYTPARSANAGADKYYDSTIGKYYIPFSYTVKGAQGTSKFYLEEIGPPDKNDPNIETIRAGMNENSRKYKKTISGTVEGYFYDNLGTSEFISIDEYYPVTEAFKFPAGDCGDITFFKADKPNLETIKHFPKYTTLNWYEAVDPKKKKSSGIVVKYTSKRVNKTFRRSGVLPNIPGVEYVTNKQMLAYGTGNNGYISIGSNVPQSDVTIEPLSFEGIYVDDNIFDISASARPESTINIFITADAVRQASYQAAVNDWKIPHTNEMTAYIVGFGSTGKLFTLQTSSRTSAEFPEPTFEKITTKSGLFTAKDQTYSFFDGEVRGYNGIEARVSSGKFDNRQKWIMGFIDGDTFGEKLDDLESPPRLYEYQEWYDSFCYDRNTVPRELTIDEETLSGLTGASKLIPIPIKGWKFNALSLKQNKTFPVISQTEGEAGNTRLFVGTKENPNYYGDLNLSGYRYLHIELSSKNNQALSGNLEITEVAKGFNDPTGSNTNFATASTNLKSWKVSTTSDAKKILRIDLCNPDNMGMEVDEQDSPYPRLNIYSNAVTTESSLFGYFKEDNNPKDNFLIAKPTLESVSIDWIDDDVKTKLKNHNFVYFRDKDTNVYDYFEINTSLLPKAGIGTDTLFGTPRLKNGYIKLSRPWDGSIAESGDQGGGPGGQSQTYRRTIWLKITKNDLTKNKTIEDIVNKNKETNTYPDEFEIYDYYTGFPDITNVLANLTSAFEENQTSTRALFCSNIPSLLDEEIPYTYIVLEDKTTNTKAKYKFDSYFTNNETQEVTFYLSNVPNSGKKFSTSTTLKLAFADGETDDVETKIYVKFRDDVVSSDPTQNFKNFEKFGDEYKVTIEYSKLTPDDKKIIPEGLPLKLQGSDKYLVFGDGVPVIAQAKKGEKRPLETVYKIDTPIEYRLADPGANSCAKAIFANDDFPEDENLNGPTYGITRVTKIQLTGDPNLELGKMFLTRDSSEADFVIGGNDHYFERQTKFQVSSTRETTYYTRRFWQQNTDGRNEEEGDVNWQMTPISTQYGDEESWTLFPKTISQFCDDINAADRYLTPCSLNNGKTFSGINTRHPGWIAKKVDTSYPTDPITGERIYGNYIDPDYLNSDTGYASWVYGGGIVALPSGKNEGSGTVYQVGIDISYNELKNIIAQTVFHRINANFPPGKPDPFGNTSLKNKTDSTQTSTDPYFDPTVQKSIVHLRGGLICRGPAHGLLLDVDKEESQTALYYEVAKPDNVLAGQDTLLPESSNGYYSTEDPYAKNGKPHFVTVAESKRFSKPAKSSTKDHVQAKRRRVSFKYGKKTFGNIISVAESGFEHALLISYTIPSSDKAYDGYTGIISTDTFQNPVFYRYSIGWDPSTGTGVSLKGFNSFLFASEQSRNEFSRSNTFILTESLADEKSSSSKIYLAANTDFRDKSQWYPYRNGRTLDSADFTTETALFKKIKYNSYAVSNYSPQIYSVGYADPGSVVFQSAHLNLADTETPFTFRALLVDGQVPTDAGEFRMIDLDTKYSGTAASQFPSVVSISSRELVFQYILEENLRKINLRLVSNYDLKDRNVSIDLDDFNGGQLDKKYNIYGLNSTYDEKTRMIKNIFWSNGNIYYYEFEVNASTTANIKIDRLHLIAGDLNDDLASTLVRRNSLITYFDSSHELAQEKIPQQRAGILSCKNQSYDDSVVVAFDTGNCSIKAVLFNPLKEIKDVRTFEIECPATTVEDTTGGDTTVNKPEAKASATPTSGPTALIVNFSSVGSIDYIGLGLSYQWDLGDGTQSTDENPSHTYVNDTTSDLVFTVTLRVTDTTQLQSDPVTLTITVNPINTDAGKKPKAEFTATPTNGDVNLDVTFTSTSTPGDSFTTLSVYSWDFYGDGNFTNFTNADPFIFTYTRPGVYNPVHIVYDNLNAKSLAFNSVTITVTDPGVQNETPTADFSYTQTNRTLQINFTDKSSDPENQPLSYLWEFDPDDPTKTSTQKNPSYIYPLAKTYNVKLTVTDSLGKISIPVIKPVVVNPAVNQPPFITTLIGTQTSLTSFAVLFEETSGDNDGFITKWSYDFGDGIGTFTTTNSSEKNPTYTYLSAGTYTVRLTVTDDGLPDKTDQKTATKEISVTILPPPENQPPKASFSVSFINASRKAPLRVNFTDTSVDPDGSIVNWLWQFDSTNQLLFNQFNYSKNVSFTYTKAGTYSVKLTVTDDQGLSDTFVYNLVVENNLPIANFLISPNPVLSWNTVTFDARSSSDTDGNITEYSWNFQDNNGFVVGSDLENKIYQTPGNYNIVLRVKDNLGGISELSKVLTVANRNPTSVITYTSLSAKAPATLAFDGSKSSDIDGFINAYEWSLSDSFNNLVSTSALVNPTFNFPVEGQFILKLKVTDNSGASDTSQVNISITQADNIPPIAILNVSPLEGTVNTTFVFDFSKSSDPDNGFIQRYVLDFGDGTAPRTYFNNSPVTYRYLKPSVTPYNAKLACYDNRGGVSVDTVDSNKNIIIKNQNPVASFTNNPTNVLTYEFINFVNTSTDPDDSLVEWTWNFGDNTGDLVITNPLLVNQRKEYKKAGTYTVTFKVKDSYGATSTTNPVNVFVKNRKPVAVITSTQTIDQNKTITVTAPTSITFNSNTSSDIDGVIVAYEWYVEGLVGTPFTTNSLTFNFTQPNNLPYRVTLRVQDDNGDFSDIAFVYVKVNQANRPPVVLVSANPPSNTSTAPLYVDFSSAGTYDPDNPQEVLSYNWDLGNGFKSTLPNPRVRYTTQGVFPVSLIVTDSKGSSTTATTYVDGSKLEYKTLNNAPVAVLETVPATIREVEIDNSLLFTSLGSFDNDVEQFINGYRWTYDGVVLAPKTATLTHLFTELGLHTIGLTVYDSLGLASSEVTLSILVKRTPPPPPINVPPVAVISNITDVSGFIYVFQRAQVEFIGNESYDPDSLANLTYEWFLTNDATNQTLLVSTNQNATLTFNEIGIFTLLLVVSDGIDKSSTATNFNKKNSLKIQVSALPPASNNLLGAGNNMFSQMALPELTRYTEFTDIEKTKKWTQISVGLYHSLYLNDANELYVSGSNTYGQLGDLNLITSNILNRVNLDPKYTVLKISASYNVSGIIVLNKITNKKEVLVCGLNSVTTSGLRLIAPNIPLETIEAFTTIMEFPQSQYCLNDIDMNGSCISHDGNVLSTLFTLGGYDLGQDKFGYRQRRINQTPFDSTNKIKVTKVGWSINQPYGLGIDDQNNQVWFWNNSALGYAYDISGNIDFLYVVIASTDINYNRHIFIFESDFSKIKFLRDYYTANYYDSSMDTPGGKYPESFYAKVDARHNNAMALETDSSFWVAGSNFEGQLGLLNSGFSYSQLDFQRAQAKNGFASIIDGQNGFQKFSGNAKVLQIAPGDLHSVIINGQGNLVSPINVGGFDRYRDPRDPYAVPFSVETA
jgi:PKD repeat protein